MVLGYMAVALRVVKTTRDGSRSTRLNSTMTIEAATQDIIRANPGFNPGHSLGSLVAYPHDHHRHETPGLRPAYIVSPRGIVNHTSALLVIFFPLFSRKIDGDRSREVNISPFGFRRRDLPTWSPRSWYAAFFCLSPS